MVDQDSLEKYIKKLIRDTDVEDSLRRLDRLTQEEAKIAAAEQLKMIHNVEGKVIGVDKRVQDIEGNVKNVSKMVEGVDHRVQGIDDQVQSVDDKIQGIDDKVQGIDKEVKDVGDKVDGKLDDINRSSSLPSPASHSELSDPLIGNLLHNNLLRWLSPSDPSINHNIANKARHNGTAQWFFQGSIFKKWKSARPFLWIHRKHEFPEVSLHDIGPNRLGSVAGSGKSVLRCVLSLLVRLYQTDMVNIARRSSRIL